jgi:hypothetical protein
MRTGDGREGLGREEVRVSREGRTGDRGGGVGEGRKGEWPGRGGRKEAWNREHKVEMGQKVEEMGVGKGPRDSGIRRGREGQAQKKRTWGT